MDSAESARATLRGWLNGAWVAQAVSTVARLHVPDRIAEHGPLSARELVERHGVAARVELLERLLRACAAIGLFSESTDGRFGATEASALLTAAAPGSLKHFAELYGGDWWRSWGQLHEVVRSGQPEPRPWDTTDVASVERFGEAMRSRVPALRPLLSRCDLGAVRTLVDVGGGFGHIAVELLCQHPALHACVVDLPAVIALARPRAESTLPPEVRARASFVAGDMFEKLPAGDVYLLSGILHDWDDASCIRILERCAAGLTPGGRLLCIDAVLPPLGDRGATQAKLLDLHMMVSLPGKERTEAEWRALLRAAGFELAEIVHPEAGRGASLLLSRRATT